MSYEHGPLRTYEVIWRSGHVERIEAHQVLLPPIVSFFGETGRGNRLTVHGEVNGHWTLILDADYTDILSVRLVSDPAVSVGGTP